MKNDKNTSWRFYDADHTARRSTRPPAGRLERHLCSAATQLATPLIDLLLDIVVWLFRIRGDAPGDLVLNSPIPTRVPLRVSRPEAAMREHSNEEKLRVYGNMYRLNVSFANIVGQCRALRESGVLTRECLSLSILGPGVAGRDQSRCGGDPGRN